MVLTAAVGALHRAFEIDAALWTTPACWEVFAPSHAYAPSSLRPSRGFSSMSSLRELRPGCPHCPRRTRCVGAQPPPSFPSPSWTNPPPRVSRLEFSGYVSAVSRLNYNTAHYKVLPICYLPVTYLYDAVLSCKYLYTFWNIYCYLCYLSFKSIRIRSMYCIHT